jgi:hypothetical protein
MQFNIFKYQDVLQKSTIGFEFEFYSNHSIEDTKRLLEILLSKKIVVEDKAHSDFIPTANEFKIEPDFSGGQELLELVTGPLEYGEARLVCINFLIWLQTNGSTSEKSAIHVNVGFDKSLGAFISKIDTLKYILDFNEDYVFSKWPNRRNSIYARTIKNIIPYEKFYSTDNTGPIDPKNYIVPSEKYYGINFSKLIQNYLEYRYLGGEGYENKIQDILDMSDYFILSLYHSVMNPNYSDKNKTELTKIIEDHKYIIDSYKSYKDFKKNLPDIKLTVDLSGDPVILNTYFGSIRDKLFSIFSKTDLRKCSFNFDTTLSNYQIKDAEFQAWEIEEVEFVNCKLNNSLIHNCNFYNSEINNSEVHDSNLFLGSIGDKSKFKNSYFNKTTKASNCYIFGKQGVFNGSMDYGIFREGKISQEAKISKNTEVVEYEEIKPTWLKIN